jgi:AcrR family transcriptional regulator
MARARIVDTDKIVAAALAIADEGGLAAVSMRSVADRLGVVPTALYRHVSNKDELLTRMADSVLTALPPMRKDVDFKTAIVEVFVELRDLMVEHHGLAELMLVRTTGATPMLAAAESALDAMENQGIPVQQAVGTLAMLQWSTLGAALHGAARLTRREDELPPTIATIEATSYPAIVRAAAAFPEGARREQFRDGLYQLLDGLSSTHCERRRAKR